MAQEDHFSQAEPLLSAKADSLEEKEQHSQDVLAFPVIHTTVFHPTTEAPARRVGYLPPGVARFVSLVGLGAALLVPLNGCNGFGDTSLPCPVPTADTAATPVTCTTSNGTHYVWIRSRGGWIHSDDGVHPNAGDHGIGVDDGHGTGGVGDGHGGEGHGGGDGG